MSNNKRSPLKEKPLHQPGESLDIQITDILLDKIFLPVVVMAFLFIIAVNEWNRLFNPTKPHPIFLTIIFIVVSAYYFYQIRKNWRHIKNLKLGRDGERIVGESLNDLKEKGYKVYHDIIGKGFNIDHIIIGPAGIFTIETKTISKAKGNPTISYDGTTLLVDGFVPDRNPIGQAKNQKNWLEGFLYNRLDIKFDIQPVVLFPGWWIKQNFTNKEVWVLNEKAFPSFLEKRASVLTPEQINLIASHIEVYNRNN